MKFDHFKKVAEDDKSATLMHPKGHKIMVAKSALSEKLKKQLSDLPMHLADGGDDQGSIFDKPEMPTEPIPSAGPIQPQLPPGQQLVDVTKMPTMEQSIAQFSKDQAAGALPAGTPPVDSPGQVTLPTPLNANPEDMAQNLGEFSQAKQAEATAMGQQADAIKAAADRQMKAVEALKAQTDERYNYLNNERMALSDDVAKGHIDANEYIHNMNGGQKAMTAIGLVLGGMGGALTRQGNPVMQFLNSQIDRDVQAQQANLGIKKTLLEANLKQFGNMKDAMDMTRIMNAEIFSAGLQKAAAQQGTALAKARADQATAMLKLQYGPMLMQQMARRQALNLIGRAQGGSDVVQNIDPASLVQALGVPEHAQKDVMKEIGNAQSAIKNGDEIMRQFDKAAKENTVLRTGAGMLRTPASILSMNALLLPIIHDAEGRVNEFEQKTTSDLMPHPGDTDSKIAEKRKAMQAFIFQKMQAPTAKSYGLDLSRFASTGVNPELRLDPKAQKYVAWAKKNPKSDLAQAILAKAGVQ